jgi:16S rRNA (guanine527-N7)-methyltransferase
LIGADPRLFLILLCLPAMLDSARIATLLEPFAAPVSAELAGHLQTYLELLLRWNARINLTAVRGPEQIVTRHFGESLFAACLLRDADVFSLSGDGPATLADLGSGAGFPGLPIKLLLPKIGLTLIESQNKKATFLREAIRTLALQQADVFCGRAESWNQTASVVTLRAVEDFAGTLRIVPQLVSPGGRMVLLIGATQVALAQRSLGSKCEFAAPVPIPQSEGRVVLVGEAGTI